jgi:DNA-binding XRE family transcriptional regulator
VQEVAYILGSAVKQARLGKKMTQLEVADRIQADERTILNIEHAKGNPKMEILWPLIRTLGIDANAVFYPEKAHERGALNQLRLLLSDCTDEELSMLLSICESVLEAFRSAQGKMIESK